VTSRCLYGKKTYPLQTCYEHNMLSLLHAVCLKVLFINPVHKLSSDVAQQSNEFFIWTRK